MALHTTNGAAITIIRPSTHKVGIPYSVTLLIISTIFDLYVVWCDSTNTHHKDICLKEIKLRAKNTSSLLQYIKDIHGNPEN